MKKSALVFFLLFISEKIFSQGCSDAGFCTIGSGPHPSEVSDTLKKQKLALLFNNGIGDEGVFVFTPALQYDIKFNNRLAIQSRLTGNYASGNLGSVFAAGDLYLSGIFQFPKHPSVNQVATLGVKLPLNSSNLEVNEKSLPMQYQSSLGTIDLIALYAVQLKKITIQIGWQQPLSGSNQNEFLPSIWNTSDAAKYPPSYELNRKGDILFRLGYELISNSKVQWNVSLLSIYHLANDEYLDKDNSGHPVELIGSKGLTLNLTTAFTYWVNQKFSIAITAGTPLIVRDIRPDGLTRAFVISPQINYHF